MRHSRDDTEHRLLRILARRPAQRAAELATELGISVPTVHRLLQQLAPHIVTAGKARRTRHALRRSVRGQEPDYPLYAIDAAGNAEQIATLIPVKPEGCWALLPGDSWPVPDEARDGWWPGLPYPLHDMRPQGYMGRQFALREHLQLAVPSNPEEWTDDDILYVLSQRGSDTVGNLILGQATYAHWLQSKATPPSLIKPIETGTRYAALANEAVSSGIAGSSAAGEFPKFTAQRDMPGMGTPHVLVKFSGAEESAAVRRWADLLICEHLALECASLMPGIQGARSRIVQHAGRTFLEVERFDRQDMFGRHSVCSLNSLNGALIGSSSSEWVKLAGSLARLELVTPETLARINQIWWFGKLIANSDMHLGNLSFRMGRPLSLTPVYDMLPMLYAPLAGGEVPPREFGMTPPLPLPSQRADWHAANKAARVFWENASGDSRISPAFRQTCTENLGRLAEWSRIA